ncbi:aldehyde dehydrogenase [Streptomyces sp. NPDC059837]|uniref:aldehyde dehydrogenase n=1 Tax=unclassified Streptomyces TaxID=2593676 RepID=UPI0022539A97|nr:MULTISPECIES: aldehyde dehydrogenase [unclassified Streptomyces]MCX4409493.1 aldehyde dehydrogenase [Streptomyces sp. NBC_01764]MCX5096934.1 aldehyde dehydrogenase [Streptomyces sp. NBC_00365]MCX5191258.1 aldehyde dehydrogenase [Streptomyces sp. NBC_00268]
MTDEANTLSYDSLYIGGEWHKPSSSESLTVTSASTGLPIGHVPLSTHTDADTAVAAARRAFNDPTGWAHWQPIERARALVRLADELDARKEEMARRVSAQNGMPYSTSINFEAAVPAGVLRYYAALLEQTPTEERRAGVMGGTTLIHRTPLGVVAAIVPWNFPQTLTFFKLAPALAAGNTIVVKPSSETLLDFALLAEAVAAAGIPAGVVNILTNGKSLGEYLVGHPDIDKISFTGSTPVGREIAGRAGKLLRPVTLELGGKSAALILDDADLASNTEALFFASLLNNGQTCFASTRILAPRSRYDEVVGFYEALAKGSVVGDALDPATQIGPMVSANHRSTVEGYIQRGITDGATLVTGGGRPDIDSGWFVTPTIFADVDNTLAIAREEIFGPVLSIIPYEGDDEAIRIANDSEYGLGGTVWTSDPERALRVAKQVQTGTIGINHYLPDFAAPYGGVKGSGVGRELGPEGLAHYQQLHSVYL